ncbi:MFS transporter [Teredinibacter franksiae]|uniref:MFS transporter n=1 Tax=Teredinibacter franksiae TaxID=2761453 RepID=UPI001628545A|nr:MFS transporter [Teredinibacter franksiae]
MSQLDSANDRTAKLSWGEKLGYGVGDAGFNFYWIIIGSYLLYFYTDIFGLTPAVASVMFLVTKIVDAFTDPLMGAIADRTKTRWGKFRPYLLFGALPMAGAATLTMSTPDLDETGKIVWAYATYSLMMLTYTILSTPYSSLSGVLTADTRERNSIFGIRFFFAYFTGILVGALTPDLADYFGNGDDATGWQRTMLLYSLIATVLFWITFFTTKERIQPPATQQPNAIQDIQDLLQNRPWLILFALALIIMITLTLRGSSAAYYFKYFVERPDLIGAYIGLQMAAYMVGAGCTPFLTAWMDKAKLLVLLMSIVGVLSIAFTFVPKPESNGVQSIQSENKIVLQASSFIDGAIPENAKVSWEEHEKVFWVVKKRLVIADAGKTLVLENAKGKVISVKISYRDPQGNSVVVDSADFPSEILVMFLLNILISLCLGPKSPLTWSMYADAADYNEWKTGRRATAMTFSAATFAQKIGGALGAAAIGAILATIGYTANQAQSDASQMGIVILQTAVPGVFAFVAIVALKFYDLSGEKLESIQADLKRRQAETD